MVSRFDYTSELSIWDDDEIDKQVDSAIMRAAKIVKPHKVTQRLKVDTVVEKDTAREQLEEFVTDWTGDITVTPSELFSLYKTFCKDNNYDILVSNVMRMGRFLSRSVNEGKIIRLIGKDKTDVYYCKNDTLKPPLSVIEKKERTKKIDSDTEEEVAAAAAPPKKRRRIDNLTTWSSVKEAEEFSLRISELEAQVKSLSDICRRQKELIHSLTGGAGTQ